MLGFLGCAAVARRQAYLAAGGYSRLLFIGGEEELLAYDLAAKGWPISYREDVIAHHWPSPARDARRRRAQEIRNRVLVAWLRRPVSRAIGDTIRLARIAGQDPDRGARACGNGAQAAGRPAPAAAAAGPGGDRHPAAGG